MTKGDFMNNQMPYGFNPNMNPNMNMMPMFPGNQGMNFDNEKNNLLEQRIQNLENRMNKLEKKIMGTDSIDNDNLYSYQSSMHMM